MKIKINVARKFRVPKVPVVLLDEEGGEDKVELDVLYRVPLPGEKAGVATSDQVKSILIDIKNLESVFEIGEECSREDAIDYVCREPTFAAALLRGFRDNTVGKNTF